MKMNIINQNKRLTCRRYTNRDRLPDNGFNQLDHLMR